MLAHHIDRIKPHQADPNETVTAIGAGLATTTEVHFVDKTGTDIPAEFEVESDYEVQADVPTGLKVGEGSVYLTLDSGVRTNSLPFVIT